MEKEIKKRFDIKREKVQKLEDELNNRIAEFEKEHDLKVSFIVPKGLKLKLGIIMNIDTLLNEQS